MRTQGTKTAKQKTRGAAVLILAMLAVACDGNAPSGSAPTETIEPAESQAQELNLSRELVDDETTVELADPDEVLPDLFEEDAEGKRVRLSGKVLTKEEAENLQSTVDGAEVKLERKTK